MFKNRLQAAQLLVRELGQYKNSNGIVLAIPRGGVPIGYEIARELGLPLEIILSKKIGHPYNPEYAIGSVTLNSMAVNPGITDVSNEYIQQESARILASLKERFKKFMGNNSPTDLTGKTVIVVDDGIATGSTMIATIEAIRKSKPKEIIIAVPVAPPDTVRKISRMVDEFICLESPFNFSAVGQVYENFEQVSDEEVISYLRAAK